MAIKQKTRGSGKAFVGEEIQVSFPALKEARGFEAPGREPGKAKFSITCLIDKDDTPTLEAYFGEITSYWGASDINELPGHPFVHGETGELNDGDGTQYQEYTGYANKVFFRASTGEEYPPELYTEIEMDGTPCDVREATADEIYAGCFGKPVINCSEYRVGKNHGVTFYLQGFVKTQVGEHWQTGDNQTRSLLGIKKASSVKSVLSASAAKPVPQEEEEVATHELASDTPEATEEVETQPVATKKASGLAGLTTKGAAGNGAATTKPAPAAKKGGGGLNALLKSGGV